ncbi:hypothetical protein [uncultured Metabacillus sp.]|uniref:hypothetical protein n=1 Tax=uncultured Metabacillus sp. TaxID=2860135 RepID=UPI00260DC82B|nr:hypothetical protein [uncultured Metabacillus sp.]
MVPLMICYNFTVVGSSMILLALIILGVAIWNIKEGVKQLKRSLGGGSVYES